MFINLRAGNSGVLTCIALLNSCRRAVRADAEDHEGCRQRPRHRLGLERIQRCKESRLDLRQRQTAKRPRFGVQTESPATVPLAGSHVLLASGEAWLDVNYLYL
jgi:hypothetical protein